MSVKLRDFIRHVRACKTAAEERAVVAKECALIRIAFKEGNSSYRHRNIAKLLFIHLMGHATHFGQFECLKLIASPKFAEKRIGYLGLVQVLDEDAEILMLVTNSIKNDLHHQSQYIVSLGLCALGNIASAEMARALAKEVEDLCNSSNPYIRKKALLCAIRLIRKASDIVERFLDVVPTIFTDKNHGVLLAGCAFVRALLEVDSTESPTIEVVQKEIPKMVGSLRRIASMTGYSGCSEYDVSGVTDPFLQASLTQTLRAAHLAKSISVGSEMQEVLAQMASATEFTKGAGNGVLFECALTIISLDVEASLKNLGLTILGRFLDNKDNNIRYVGLVALRQLLKKNVKSVQKYRKTVLDCLREQDCSLRRMASEVLFRLIDKSSISSLFDESLSILSSSNDQENYDFRKDFVSKLCTAINLYSPTYKWQFDSLVKIMRIYGTLVPQTLQNSLIALLMRTQNLQSYAVHKLFATAKQQQQQLPQSSCLLRVTIWSIGEFGDLLIQQPNPCDPQDVLNFLVYCAATVGNEDENSETSLLIGSSTLLENTPPTSWLTLLLNCLVKLSARFPQELRPQISKLAAFFKNSIVVELQQRACEYEQLLKEPWDEARSQLFDRIPIGPRQLLSSSGDDRATADAADSLFFEEGGLDSTPSAPHEQHGSAANTVDLLRFSEEETSPAPFGGGSGAADVGGVVSGGPESKVESLLSDLFPNNTTKAS